MPAPIVSWPAAPDNDVVRRQAYQMFDVSTGEFSSNAATDAWVRNPTTSAARFFEMDDAHQDQNSPIIQAEDLQKKYGLDGRLKFDAPMRESAAQMLYNLKLNEIERADVAGRGHGFFTKGAGVASSLGANLADPLNIASAFIPVVGEARGAQILGRMEALIGKSAAESFLVRSGARSVKGFIEGTVGAEMVEPIVLGQARQEQADYDFSNSLENIIMGGVGGSVLHTGLGAIGDAWEGKIFRNLDHQTVRDMFKGALTDALEGREIMSPERIMEMDAKKLREEAIRSPEIQEKFGDLTRPAEVSDRFTVVGSRMRGDNARGADFDLVTKLTPEEERAWVNTPEGEHAIVPQDIKEAALAGHDTFMLDSKNHLWKVEEHPEFPGEVFPERISEKAQSILTGTPKGEEPPPFNSLKETSDYWKSKNPNEPRRIEMEKAIEQKIQEISEKKLQEFQPSPKRETPETPSAPVDKATVPEQQGVGKPVDPESEVSQAQQSTQEFIKDHEDKFTEADKKTLKKFDEQLSEAKKKAKGYLQAVSCLAGKLL